MTSLPRTLDREIAVPADRKTLLHQLELIDPAGDLARQARQIGVEIKLTLGGQSRQHSAAQTLYQMARDNRRARHRLKIARLLDGFRGGPRGDKDALMAVACYAEANRDTLAELNVNPLLVLPEGEEVVRSMP